MVTILNKDSSIALRDKYSKLFAKAFSELDAMGRLSQAEKEKGRFDSLDAYFAHMGDLLETNKPIYMLLPLDETPFVIDGNTRTITIPKEFSKCGAVKGDNYCEIATFIVDRYFDFKDLAESNIVVQWVNANKEEGISHIQLIDLESEPGKIRFGWPLTEDITKYPGIIKFSVRFFINDPADTKKFYYLLNTIPSALTVKDGLYVTDPKHIKENDFNMFKSFVANSQNPADTIPATPFFTEINGGEDLPARGAIGSNNELTMTAQAVANDLGTINYQWFYSPAGTSEKIAIDVSDATYEVEKQKYVAVPVPEKRGLDQYWINTGSEEAASWELYTGEWPPVEGTQLYEIKTELTIVDSENDNVVGNYWVEAVNTIGRNSTNPSPSTVCNVPAPAEIEYTTNLKAHQFIEKGKQGTTLSISIKEDKNEPAVTYYWYNSVEGPNGDYDLILGAEDKNYIATQAGWYKAVPQSLLNRKIETKESNICKVTKMPEAPIIEKLSYKLDNATDYTELQKLVDGGAMLDVYKYGNIISLKVDTNLDDAINLGLLAETLTYTWYVQEPDTPARELTEKDIGLNTLLDVDTVLNSKEIKVRCVSDGAVYSYYCVITNEIQGKTAEVNSSSYNTFTIA